MPFLIPAVTALASDVFLLWLGSTAPVETVFAEDHWVYHVDYLAVPVALLRLFLLCLPLLFHSYTGTAVQHVIGYQVFYGATSVALALHMLGLALMDPESLEAIFPQVALRRFLLQHLHELRRIWWILLLSSYSVSCHWILLWHVRSTAPNASYNLQQQRSGRGGKPPTVYFAVRAASIGNVADDNNDNDNSHDENQLMHAMNDFVVDMQSRLLKAKSEWAAKLEDFGHKISSSSTHATNNNLGSSRQFNAQTKTTAAVTPFRVLLQLFAYEDVLNNGKLDAAFDMDDGEALTFYVPQLLSFLLHGALYCSPVLEEWILEKCRRNVHFAHRCFWFLRAWCLEVPADARMCHSRRSSHNSLTNSIHSGNGSNAINHQGLQPFLDEPAETEADSDNQHRSGNLCLQRQSATPSSTNLHQHQQLTSSSSVAGSSSIALDKFLPEERAMIERLMMRVKECGEDPARRIEFLITSSSGDTVVPTTHHHNSSTTADGVNGNSYSAPVSAAPSNDEDLVDGDDFAFVRASASLPLESHSHSPAASYEQIHSPQRPVDNREEDTMIMIPQRDGLKRRLHSTSSCRSRSHSPPPLQQHRSRSPLADTQKSSHIQYHQQQHRTAFTDYDCSPAAMLEAAECGKLPVDPGTGYPSVKHFDAMVAYHHGWGLFQTSSLGHLRGNEQVEVPQHSYSTSETEHFDKAPQFLDALIFLAENLFLVPRDERKETMQQQLRSLECELLPSNSVYVPIGNSHHRVWRIVSEESLCISTKERVPCIVVLEVIDYSISKKRKEPRGAWNALLGGLPKRPARAVSAGAADFVVPSVSHHEDGLAPPATVMPTSTVSMPMAISATAAAVTTVSTSTSMHSSTDTAVGEWSDTVLESEIVAQWRYGHRDPLRRVSLLDKMTTSVKAPFDKMKTQVRDHFIHLRDRTGSTEEMQALALSEYLVDPERGGVGRDHSTESNRDLEGRLCTTNAEDRNGLLTHAQTSTDTYAGVSSDNASTPIRKGGSQHRRTNSTSSTLSLGQWSSPPAPDKPIKDNEIQRNLQDLRARLNTELLSVHNGRDAAHRSRKRTSPLPYGSDQEDDPTERSQRPPRSQKARSSYIPLASASSMEQGDATTKSTTRSPPVVFRESWIAKEERIRQRSAFGDHPGWHLLPIMIKANDDLRQEQLASQLIQRMAAILAREKVPVWLCPYEIIALTDRAGIIEAIPDTISLDALKKNGAYTNLCDFFHNHFGLGTEELAGAKANFVESLAAYSIVCFLLQIKDRHNGNILLDTNGHIIHIDFGFFFLSSPGKNAGFESAPWKLTREAIEVMGGTDSHLFRVYRELCIKTFLTLRKRCMEIILLVEMLKNGNEELQCFRGRPDDAIRQLRERFRLDLNDRACREYVQSLVDDSIENWRTDWYDRYQRYFVGIL